MHEHAHEEKDNHCVFCLKGSIVANIDDDIFELKAGSFLTMDKGARHSYKVTQDDTVVLHLLTHPPREENNLSGNRLFNGEEITNAFNKVTI